jgi:hypothetical protein
MQAEADVLGGAGVRISPFLDGYDALSLLQRAGFALPAADVDRVKVRYDHPLRLLAELRAMGETSAFADREGPGVTRGVLARACELYVERFSETDGRLPATFDIVTLTGWGPA